MPEPTIRQRIEGIKTRHVPVDRFDVYDQPMPEPQCQGCTRPWPCPDRVAADAVLATLNASAIVNPAFSMHRGRERVIADPDGVPARDEFDNPHNDHEAMWSRD